MDTIEQEMETSIPTTTFHDTYYILCVYLGFSYLIVGFVGFLLYNSLGFFVCLPSHHLC